MHKPLLANDAVSLSPGSERRIDGYVFLIIIMDCGHGGVLILMVLGVRDGPISRWTVS